MKKLKLDLNGIGELLSKEQMKMVTGGDSYSAGYLTCNYTITTWGGVISKTEGHYNVDLGDLYSCSGFCNARMPSDPNYTYVYFANCSMENVIW